MILIGACILRKGLNLLLKVLENLKDFAWRLIIENWAYSIGPRPTPPWTDESSTVPE